MLLIAGFVPSDEALNKWEGAFVDKVKDLEHILNMAIHAGFNNARIDGDLACIRIPHDFGNGRVQHVSVSIKVDEAGECTPENTKMVVFESTCLSITKGTSEFEDSSLPLELLEQNSTIHFGRFAISSDDSERKIFVSCDQLFSNLDKNELQSVVRYVAKVADTCEHEYHGLDKF